MMFIVKICSITGLIAGVVYLLFGYSIYRSQRTIKVVTLLFLWMIACAVWSLGVSIISLFNAPLISFDLWVKIAYLGALSIPILFYHLTYSFLGFRKRQYLIPFGYGIATSFSFLIFLNQDLIRSIQKIDSFYYLPGSLYLFNVFYFVGFVGYSYYLLYATYKLAIGYKKSQIKYLMVSSLFVLTQVATSFPILYNVPITNFLGILALPFFSFAVYGIWKYKLFNINLALDRESVQKIFFAFTLSVCVFFIVVVGNFIFQNQSLQNKNLYLMAAYSFLIFLFMVRPIDKLITAFTERFLFQKKYEYQKTLRDAARGMAKITDIDKLFGLIVHFITSRIRIKSVDLFYLNRGDDKYVARLSRGSERFNDEEKDITVQKNSSLVLWLEEKKDILIYDEVVRWLKNEKLFPHKTVLRKTLDDIQFKFEELETELCVPCFSKNKLLGFLMLGEKTSGEIYTQEDLDVLSTLSHEAAIAIENAQLYEEIYDKMRHIQSLYEKERKLFVSTAIAFAAAIDAKDKYTHGHAERVTYYCMSIYEEMQLLGLLDFPQNFHETLQISALLHDVGKIGTPDHILNKKGPLTKDEFEEIKRHPIIGASILQPIQELAEVTAAIRHHQEKYDGTGYPGELKGDEIPLAARIIMVADTFDAMVSDRPYRSRVMEEVAVGEIKRGIGTQFDPKVVEGFLSAYEKGKIVQINTQDTFFTLSKKTRKHQFKKKKGEQGQITFTRDDEEEQEPLSSVEHNMRSFSQI